MRGVVSRYAGLRSVWIILIAVAGAVLANLAIYGVARLLGVEFWFTAAGGPLQVLPPVLIQFTAVPLLAGLTIAAIVGHWWRWVFLVAIIVAVVLEVGTIFALTIPADFDTGSTVALALCHLAMVPFTVAALLALRLRRDARRERKQE
ncbi:hypothetical protein FBY40_0754 [Microbacterium sp. SLBN-154]|uniref:DUF6069 family protein n=1 Tax=Microbacterium sp. SLBN-154 TaxID=2768458 RepID=UPI00114EDC30|nr:DUF6069 family protein [Microbacterium sp. SLBN-154]TQK18267.1 hypothetical protein FBY40_0754 [Microbacterium sp. SLBN-154]